MHINQNLEQINTFESYLYEGVQHPKSIFKLWDRDEKAAIGIYEVVHEPVPDGLIATEWSYKIEGNYALATPTLEQKPEPVVEVPEKVSRAQGKVALIMAGQWDGVVAYVNGKDDPTTKLLAKTALYDTQEWRRDSPFLIDCAEAMDMTEEDLDNLFIAAEKVKL